MTTIVTPYQYTSSLIHSLTHSPIYLSTSTSSSQVTTIVTPYQYTSSLTHSPIYLSTSTSSQVTTIAAADESDFNMWLDAISDTLELREMAIQNEV